MKPGTCNIALFVKDIEKSKDFYCNLLGLTIKLDFGKNVIFSEGVTAWEIQKNHIIPVKLGLENISDIQNNRFELYFETEELEHVLERLMRNGIRFLHNIHEEPWGQRTIRFFDPDNHLIEFGESMQTFIKRFHETGLSPEEISKRTSVPVAEVKRLI